MGTQVSLSSAFHPQTDGQSEQVNQVLEQFLCCSVNYQQDDWLDLLPAAEFAYNNATHASTKMTPFFANYGYHSWFEFQAPTSSEVPVADDHVTRMQEVTQVLASELKSAQDAYKYYADKHHLDTPLLEPGDQVWLL
jgi:hypothetical protein